MLTPEYLERIAEGAEDIAEQLHQDILDRIVKRITHRLARGDDYILTAQDKWQLEVLQEAGYLREDLQKEIAKRTRLQMKEIKEAFEDAGVVSHNYDSKIYEAAGLSTTPLTQSPHLVRLMQRGYDKTLGEWQNFTGTMADAAQQLFISECDKAYNLVATGAVSYTQAFREAIERIAEDGVTVTYPSGHTDTIETATLRAVRTGVAQATADITLTRMQEMDWDIILTSAHLGARVTDKQDFTNHFWWQGKFYSRSGRDARFPPFSVCGYGNVQGIDGANCRHSFMPGDGEHNPFEDYDSEENKKAYELSQRQRTLERRIRKTKRETMTLKTALDNAPDEAARAEIEASYQRKAALLQKQNKAYNEFCEANGLKKRAERIAIAKWDRKQAAAARGAARKAANKKDIEVTEIFKTNAEYINNKGEFDLKKANENYSEFLKTVPEKNRMYLEQSFNAVEYEKRKLKTAAFGYSAEDDCIFYDPSKPNFKRYPYNIVNTHELAHRIDRMFVGSWENEAFSRAIVNAAIKDDENAVKLSDFCHDHDKIGYISDIVSALSNGELNLPFGHDPEYWAKGHNKEIEIFANLFAAEAVKDQTGIDFIEENFKELYESYKQIKYTLRGEG